MKPRVLTASGITIVMPEEQEPERAYPPAEPSMFLALLVALLALPVLPALLIWVWRDDRSSLQTFRASGRRCLLPQMSTWDEEKRKGGNEHHPLTIVTK